MIRRLALLVLVSGVMPVLAQDASQPGQTPQPADCPTIVQTAITLTGERCEKTAQNQICYGHLILDARPRIGLADFGFDQPGDIVDVVEVQSLRLSALDTTTGGWGVVMMQIEAQLAQLARAGNASPDVQILLFGDAELNDATHFLPGEMRVAANIREQPLTSSGIVTTLDASDKITANGRLADNSWVRVNLGGHSGWIRSDLVTLRGDVASLAEIPADNSEADRLTQFGPMQAFYFRSGVDDAPCAEAPNSGLLIQTPEGVASISIWLDEVVVQLDATAFIQAQPDGHLTINVLNGHAQVTARNETRTAVSGMQVSVPLDDHLTPADVPGDPIPFDPSDVQSLPLQLLNRPVEIPEPRPVTTGVPIDGQWQFRWDVAELTCPDGTVVPFESTGATSPLNTTEESLDWNKTHYTQSSPGVYRSSYVDSSGNLHQDTLQVTAPDRIVGEKVLDLVSPACTLHVGFLLQLFSASP